MTKKAKLIFYLGMASFLITGGFWIYTSTINSLSNASEAKTDEDHHDDHEEKKEIRLTEEQIKNLDIQTLKLVKTHFQQRITLPGQVVLNENKITHIVTAVPGIVKDIFKNLGEEVKTGEPLATLQSLNMAEAKSDYISAYANLALKEELLQREKKLWEENVKSEIEFIQAQNAFKGAKITVDQSKQKLLALNVNEDQILQLPDQKTPLNLYTIESPIDGKVIERHITPGEVISNDKQIFVIANLNTVWVNLAIPAEDLPKVKKDQKVNIFGHRGEVIEQGTIMYVSPVINDESRSGRAIIELNNEKNAWHPGDFIKTQVVINDQSSFFNLHENAIQRIEGEPYVFVKTGAELFEAKKIQVKNSDRHEYVEIISGVKEGDEVVIKNSFILKAELGKNEAEHAH